MDKLLVSACLLGTPCRYDGKSKADARVQALVGKYEIVPVCPEQLGGLPTPRVPSERRGERVVTAGGRDVTEAYRRGAEAALALCQQNGCEAQGKEPELRLRADLRRNFFPPPDRGRRRDGGVVQGARHSRLRRERCGEAVNADDMPVIFYAVYRQNFSCL